MKTLRLFGIVLAFGFGQTLFGQTMVDNPCGLPGSAWPVDGNCYSASTIGMTPLYNPGTCFAGARDDAWTWFVGDGNNIDVTYNPDTRDAILHVFEVTALPCTVLEIGCSDVGGNGVTENVNFNSVMGTNYFVRIQRWNSNLNMTGNLCITSNPPGGGSGDDCANAIGVTCGDPTLVGETTVGNTNTENNWPCHGVLTPGDDRYYAVTVTGASNNSIRCYISNASDATSNTLEVLFLGNTCGINACDNGFQYDFTTQLFTGGAAFCEVTVPGPGTYYFVVDDQGTNGIDSYDIQFQCFDAGIELDVVNSCPPIPGGEPANQGLYVTWNGAAPPATVNAAAMPGTYTVCENMYIMNPNGWQWLMSFDVVLGSCWTNVNTLNNFTPNSPPGNNAFYPSPQGTWSAAFIPGGANQDTIRWGDFVHNSNPTWGDGDAGFYSCYLYTFCFDATVDPTCTDPVGFENYVEAMDDGVGGSGGTSSPSTITVPNDDPVINTLPIELISFTAKVLEYQGDHAVQLDWVTASELNNDYFIIERSVDGITFEEVFVMDGAGTSNETNHYIGFDEDPYMGTSYYRLTQVDHNGDFETFHPVAVNINANENQLTVSPVPANEEVVFNLISVDDNDGVIEITDIQGRIVEHLELDLAKGENRITYDLGTFSKGLYFVRLVIDNEIQIAKMVVEK